MAKLEFMNQLASELHKRNIADAADVLKEYEQHFAFKLSDGYSEEEIADGYSEEEIAARLGSPADLAAQFEPAPQGAKRRLRRAHLSVARLAGCVLRSVRHSAAGVVRGLLCAVVRRVRHQCRFGPVLARLGLVRELKSSLFP